MRPQLRTKRRWVVEPVGIEVRNLPKPIAGKSLFGNGHPLELEIGVGKGTFLVDQARCRPQINFLGIEQARRYWMYASDRMRRNDLTNARIVHADAAYFIAGFITDGSLAAVHVYFPDPWPKARHHKRRLIQEPLVAELDRALEPGGRLQIVTDHSAYFQQIQEVVRSSALEPADYVTPGTAEQGEFVGTNFERKYRREGRPFHAIAAVKPRPR
jgi:tRNA (guanine-N7-)-methyltransferase